MSFLSTKLSGTYGINNRQPELLFSSHYQQINKSFTRNCEITKVTAVMIYTSKHLTDLTEQQHVRNCLWIEDAFSKLYHTMRSTEIKSVSLWNRERKRILLYLGKNMWISSRLLHCEKRGASSQQN